MDYKALYEQQLQENKKLQDLVEYWKDCYEMQQKDTDIEHQRYLEVSEKYSNTLWEVCQELNIENDDTSQNIIKEINQLAEENEVMKTTWIDENDAGQMIADLKKEQVKEIKTMKNKCLKSVCKLNKKIKELQKQIEELQKDVLTDEPEVETCRECNTKRECLSDIFITIRELDGTESVMCGMCSLNHFKSKS